MSSKVQLRPIESLVVDWLVQSHMIPCRWSIFFCAEHFSAVQVIAFLFPTNLTVWFAFREHYLNHSKSPKVCDRAIRWQVYLIEMSLMPELYRGLHVKP